MSPNPFLMEMLELVRYEPDSGTSNYRRYLHLYILLSGINVDRLSNYRLSLHLYIGHSYVFIY